MGFFSKGLKNEFERAVVNEPSVFEPLKFYCIVNFPFVDGGVPRLTSHGVHISQLIRFARVSSHVDDFNTRNKVLTANLFR